MNLKSFKSFFIAVASTAGILTLSSPASAVIYDWQFTNEDGNFGEHTDVVAGLVEFDDAGVASGSASAIDFQITSVTNLPNGSDPFFGDGGIELNTNLVGSSFVNNFSFNNNQITGNFWVQIDDTNGHSERFNLGEDFGGGVSLDNQEYIGTEFFDGFYYSIYESFYFQDRDSSTLMPFGQATSASVPFEFSPTLGLVLAGSVFAGRGYIKRRQARSIIETK